MDMNTWTGVGRLADSVTYTAGKDGKHSRAVGRLIVNRPPSTQTGESDYDVIPIVAWGKRADSMARFTGKGKELGIRGQLRTSSVRPKNAGGEWKNYFEVMIEHVSFGRDSQQGKLMKALSGGSEVVEQALTAIKDAGNIAEIEGGDFMEQLATNPQLVDTLKNIAQGVRPGSTVIVEDEDALFPAE